MILGFWRISNKRLGLLGLGCGYGRLQQRQVGKVVEGLKLMGLKVCIASS